MPGENHGLDDLWRRDAWALAGGGADAVARQHAQGKRTARERLDLLFDPGSFVEIGRHVTHRSQGLQDRRVPTDAVVTGFGLVDGRTVYAFSQDFTSMGGTLGEMHARKIQAVQDLALQNGVPLVGINDSGGARIQEGVDALDGFARIFARNVRASGIIPQISVIAGPCAGGAVYSPALTDFIVMVERTSHMFITGPEVVRAVLGEEVSLEALGGGAVHAEISGVCDLLAKDEEECFRSVRRLLSYLPSNNLEDPPSSSGAAAVVSSLPFLREAVPGDPRLVYEMRDIIAALLDPGSFLELHARWGQSAVISLGRMAGRAIGVVANQPRVRSGCLDIDSSDKIARFVRLCDTFNLPLLTLVDTPGYLPGVDQEHRGIIRHGAKVLYAYAEASVPKVSLILRKAYGGAYIAMCSKGIGCDLAAAWPQAEIAVMGPEAAVNIIFRREIQGATDTAVERSKRMDDYRTAYCHPYVAAERQYVDTVLDPADSRSWICSAFAALDGKRADPPARKHGNLPL